MSILSWFRLSLRFKKRMGESSPPRGYSNLPETEIQPQQPESPIFRSKPSKIKDVPLGLCIWSLRRYLILVLTPVLLMPIPITIPGKEARCAYCILIMAVYWVTEVVELAVTALLPLVLFPLFGVLGSKDVSTPYFKDTNVLFLGGLIVAVAVETWNLHKRIALRILLLVGAQPRRLMLGVMLTTSFLSMWISNTATTAMMVPIVEAVLREIKNKSIKNRLKGNSGNRQTDELDENVSQPCSWELDAFCESTEKEGKRAVTLEEHEITRETGGEENDHKDDGSHLVKNQKRSSDVNLLREEEDIDETHHYSKFCKAMMLAVAYAANIGGTATLTGTGPNLVFGGIVNHLFPDSPGFSFASWFGYAFPQMVILLSVAWLWIQLLFFGFNCRKCFRNCIRKCLRKGRWSERRENESTRAIRQVLVDQYRALGPMSFAEKAVLGHFIALALLWLFRDPKFMKGWSIIFEKGYVRDATAAMTVAFSLFVFPSRRPRIFAKDGSLHQLPPGLLEFKTMSKRFPWHLVVLLGSGFALAKACQESGLSKCVGTQLAHLDGIPSFAIVICVCVMITSFTEFTSNVATATIFLPILASLGEHIQVHPWYLMLPATLSCSFAYMLPVATPPNAIVFAGGHLKVKDMARAGLGMNILAVTVLFICINTYGVAMFDLNTFPTWAASAATGAAAGGGRGLDTNSNAMLICSNITTT